MSARAPSDIPQSGWREILLRVLRRSRDGHLSMAAAAVAFYAVRALFPLSATAMEVLAQQVAAVRRFAPATLVAGTFTSLVLLLWSAVRGARTLIAALNLAYGEAEHRTFARLHADVLLLSVAGLLLWLVAGMALLLPASDRLATSHPLLTSLISIGRWPLLAVLMYAFLGFTYRVGPSRSDPRWSWVSLGAATATGLSLIASALLSLYVGHFAQFDRMYGSVGAIVVMLLWLLLGAYAIVIGAQISAESEREARNSR